MMDLDALEKLLAARDEHGPWRHWREAGCIVTADPTVGYNDIVADRVQSRDAALIVAAVNGLPELLRLARLGAATPTRETPTPESK